MNGKCNDRVLSQDAGRGGKAEPIICVENLKKSFGDLEVLRGITECIYEGEVVSVIGPSGGGKSTFLRCLNCLEKPTSGKVLFRGTDITDASVNIDKFRQKMGMVFQSFNVFPHLKVIDNITITPVLEKKVPKAEAEKRRVSFWIGWDFWTKRMSIPASFPEDRSRGWRLCGLLRWSRI